MYLSPYNLYSMKIIHSSCIHPTGRVESVIPACTTKCCYSTRKRNL